MSCLTDIATIVPGRAFTRRLYAYVKPNMRPYHHICMMQEIKSDMEMWCTFMKDPSIYCRPFIDFTSILTAEELEWTTDASAAIGVRGIWGSHWFHRCWNKDFLDEHNPSIEYLELFGVTTSVLLWGEQFRNKRISLQCDNQSVVHMINNSTSACKN